MRWIGTHEKLLIFLSKRVCLSYFFLYASAVRFLLSLPCLRVLQVFKIFEVYVHTRISMISEKYEIRSSCRHDLLSYRGINTYFILKDGKGEDGKGEREEGRGKGKKKNYRLSGQPVLPSIM